MLTFSPETHPQLAEDPDPRESPLKFERSILGNPASQNPREHPFLGHVQIVDLDQDGRPDVLVCDSEKSAVTWIHNQNGIWKEDLLATVPNPVHTQVLSGLSDGSPDIIVACLGAMGPTDDLVGSVVLLVNDGPVHFTPVTILDHASRVADVEPGDFNGDGDTDFVVALFARSMKKSRPSSMMARADSRSVCSSKPPRPPLAPPASSWSISTATAGSTSSPAACTASLLTTAWAGSRCGKTGGQTSDLCARSFDL